MKRIALIGIQDMSPRNYELDIFDLSIHPHKGYIYKCILYHRNLIEHVLGYIYKKMRHIKFLKAPSSAWIYDESMFNNITPPNHYIARSYFQSHRYFNDIRNLLLKDFTFKFTRSKRAQEYEHEIHNYETTVSIHVRRTDYLNLNIFTILGEEYYHKAIQLMGTQCKVDHYFIFSDDIDCAEALFKSINIRYTMVKGTTMYDDLYLMTQCHHHIIANSTFSWWGAWLNLSKDKIVIAPKQWATDQNSAIDICPDLWIQI